jgi:CIC family chloride channel protein
VSLAPPPPSRWRGWFTFAFADETRLLVALSLAIGVGSGLAAFGFRWLIETIHHVFWIGDGSGPAPWTSLRAVLAPAAGGALVGPLVYFLAREAKGHGVPEVMLAIAEQAGRIRARVVLVKALASALCIGSGGSAGREGPIVQIGSAFGSAIGQLMRLPPEMLRTGLAAGAAGGVAATFNAPIAGVVFSLEVLLREFSARAFSIVVLASVTATVISRALLGDYPAFFVPPYELLSAWELLFYAVLGVLAALVGRAFIWLLYRCEDVFDAWSIPEYLKPIAGGLGVGLLGLALPQTLGVGYGAVEEALQGRLAPWLLATLLFGKLVTTTLTLGSGGSGGIFSPSLFMGAMLGGAVGNLFGALFPAITAPPGAYALVAMAAVFGGAAHAPITAILILFEMTGDYRIILPLMTAVVVSTLVSHVISPETIYTIKLRRRGIDVLAPRRADPLGQVRVADVMVRDPVRLESALPFRSVLDHLRRHPFTSFPVVDGDRRLVGILGYSELREALTGEVSPATRTAGDLMRTPPPVSYVDETLTDVTAKFAVSGVGRLPVVSRGDPTTLLGVISHSDVLAAYQRVVLRRPAGP